MEEGCNLCFSTTWLTSWKHVFPLAKVSCQHTFPLASFVTVSCWLFIILFDNYEKQGIFYEIIKVQLNMVLFKKWKYFYLIIISHFLSSASTRSHQAIKICMRRGAPICSTVELSITNLAYFSNHFGMLLRVIVLCEGCFITMILSASVCG